MQVIAAGGLHVVGTERHESRRIDNQVSYWTVFNMLLLCFSKLYTVIIV
jgi:hypothetical protein